MQSSEREFRLGLNAHRSRNTEPRRLLLQVIQQRGLADTRLAVQDQHPAPTRPRLSQQPIQRGHLGAPATQSRPRMTVLAVDRDAEVMGKENAVPSSLASPGDKQPRKDSS